MTTSPERRRARIMELDRRIASAARGVRVLRELSWPTETLDAFLESWRRGEPRLPKPPEISRMLHVAELNELQEARRDLDEADPVHRFLDHSAGSYRVAARMLATAGTAEFHSLSRVLYGAPTDRLPGGSMTHLEAADQLLEATVALTDAGLGIDGDPSIPSGQAAEWMREKLREFFGDRAVEVTLDPHLAAKAAAGATRVRLREGIAFSQLELDQLLQHEAFVHTATALNGREQPVLSTLALGAPRTTLTQEGLATVAELVTHVIDIARLRRIALRIRGTHLAIEGADFVDVFRFFLERGQSEEESVRSTMRIFRGGDVRGRWVFTKDVVYLQGLIAVHVFLRKAIETRRPFLIERLFAGRMALADVVLLEEAFDDGLVVAPAYVPSWARNLRSLAAYLAFTSISYRIDLDAFELEEILPSFDF